MRRFLRPMLNVLLFAMILTGSLLAQDFKPATAANAKQFLGTWQSSFQGKVFLTIVIAGGANELSGSMSHFDVEVNDAGELTKAEVGEGSNKITGAQVNGNRLRITTKSSDGSEDSTDSEMVLSDAGEAELRMIVPPDVPPDVPRPKPWKLSRAPHS